MAYSNSYKTPLERVVIAKRGHKTATEPTLNKLKVNIMCYKKRWRFK